MKSNKVLYVAVAVLVALILLGLTSRIDKLEQSTGTVGVAGVTQCITDPHNHGFNADCESMVENGHDISMYSGIFGTGQTIKLEGAQGNITATGTAYILGDVSLGDDFAVGGTVTLNNGPIINAKGAVTVTDDFELTGDFYMNSGGTITQRSGAVTITDDLDVAGDVGMHAGGRIIQATGAVTVADELQVDGGATCDNLYTVYDGFIGRWLNLDDHATITVTSWLTPSLVNSFSPIAAASRVSPTVASGCVPGDLWIIENWGAANIGLVDSGNLYLAGDWTGGQHDTLTLICDPGGNWIELTRANN